MASGAVAMEQYLRTKWRRTVQIGITALLVAGGIVLAPVSCPLMSPQATKKYIAGLGLHFDLESGKMGEPLPQWLADRIGWEELAAETGLVYHALSQREQRNAVIISTNYGPAGALELYGKKYGLPPVYATHNSFHSWGPPSDTVKTFIGVYIDSDDVSQRFDSVEEASVYHCPDCTRPMREIGIYILRGPNFSMKKEWGGFRNYN
jgi:hypothetical protein